MNCEPSSIVATVALDVPFPAIVLAAALAGAVGGRLAPAGFGGTGGGHGTAARGYGPALIDDATPPPAHARFSRGRLVGVLAAGIALWAVAFAALRLLPATATGAPVFADIGGFFTKAALLTFGGAYAVLPYLYQGAV
jgi:chromate transporter